MKRFICALMAVFIFAGLAPAPAMAALYADVPDDSWAISYIKSASEYKLMEGVGGGSFGYGESVTRAQFVTIICRMFGWNTVTPASASFTDVKTGAWYYGYVETGLSNGAFDKSSAFRPDAPITRSEMAVMLVRALGYKDIADNLSETSLPFTDVQSDRGYIAVAYDIGMINGMTATTFAPSLTASREQAAAMLVRIYEKLTADTDWYHGFYAFSSYSQRALTDDMEAVSVGWSRIYYSAESGAYLNTTSSGGNTYCIPTSYESIVSYLGANGTAMNLMVYMDNSDGTAKAVLTSESARKQAADAILNELTAIYKTIGKNPYAGVTVDFEGLKGDEMRAGMDAFLSELSDGLKSLGKSLYVTVQPVLDGEYYDGFDYHTIGTLADRVILMAHDYNPVSLAGFEGSTYYRTAALTPIESVYLALCEITDSETGVPDVSKVALAISFKGMAWEISGGKLVSGTPVYPSTETIYKRLTQADTVIGWSDQYMNPYATYTAEDGKQYFLWYEDARSVEAKVTLARLFGVDGVSVWRLGTIPAYGDAGIYFDVTGALK